MLYLKNVMIFVIIMISTDPPFANCNLFRDWNLIRFYIFRSYPFHSIVVFVCVGLLTTCKYG